MKLARDKSSQEVTSHGDWNGRAYFYIEQCGWTKRHVRIVKLPPSMYALGLLSLNLPSNGNDQEASQEEKRGVWAIGNAGMGMERREGAAKSRNTEGGSEREIAQVHDGNFGRESKHLP